MHPPGRSDPRGVPCLPQRRSSGEVVQLSFRCWLHFATTAPTRNSSEHAGRVSMYTNELLDTSPTFCRRLLSFSSFQPQNGPARARTPSSSAGWKRLKHKATKTIQNTLSLNKTKQPKKTSRANEKVLDALVDVSVEKDTKRSGRSSSHVCRSQNPLQRSLHSVLIQPRMSLLSS